MKAALPARPGGTGPAASSKRPGAIAIVLVALAAFGVWNLFAHHENRYEKLATDVTHAVAANDMKPVESEFNALRRPQLENRAKVGALSDFVNAEGALRSVKEDTPSGSAAGYHHFIATFERGKRSEDLTVDADGKVANFHVRPFEGS